MSSGFVSGGTADAPVERSDEWLTAQKEIEANIVRKAEQARQQDGKSLFETLEANKAAKEEAFAEANRLKNQFRALDEDEAEFLDSVLESTRAEEARIKKQTAEGLALFRQQQEEADKKARTGGDGAINAEEGSPVAEEESWIAGGRKRKRTKDKEVLKGVKIRRSSTANTAEKPVNDDNAKTKATSKPESAKATASSDSIQNEAVSTLSRPLLSSKPSAPAKGSLGLVDYGSDDDDE